MGAIQFGMVAITAFDISFAALPDTAYSYDGTARDISQFYDQKVPNFYVGGYVPINNNLSLSFTIDTGTHTDKLNTASLSLGPTYTTDFGNGWSFQGSAIVSSGYSKHTSCTDSYSREYYCMNLTAFSDVERTRYENDYEINGTYTYRW